MGCGSSSQSAGGAHGPVISSQAPATVGGAASQTTANATPVVEEPKTLTPAGSSGVKFSGDIGSTAKDGSPSQPEVQTQPAPVEKEPDKRGDNVEGSKGMDDPASIEGGKARAGEETQGPPKKPEAIGGGRVAARQHKEKRPAKKPISRVATEAFSLESEKAKVRRAWAPDYRPSGIRPAGRPGAALVTGEKQTRTSLPMLLDDFPMACKTKVVCTLGPRCWSEEGIASLLDAGLDVARLNFSHGSHADHQRVLDRFRAVCGARGSSAAVLLDTKGPEIRTAMLRGGKDIDLAAGQEVTVVAVGDEYETWEGFRDEATGETRIGLSYPVLCQSVSPGDRILLADGSITIEVVEISGPTELRGRALNSRRLGQRKNCNLPGVRVDLPVLTEKDIRDLQRFACPNAVDYVAASFVQGADDVRRIRATMAEAGGSAARIIAKIENAEGLRNFDEILRQADGIMVARGDLGMEVPSEKVALAQKMMVTKANLAGKPVICATQMLESMCESQRPTRAEMTDVANAVFDGVDAVMLSGETAAGLHPALAVQTLRRIASCAEVGVDYRANLKGLKEWRQARGLGEAEAVFHAAVKSCVDFSADKDGNGVIDSSEGCVLVVGTETGAAAAALSSWHPPCPVVAVCASEGVLRRCKASFGICPCLVTELGDADFVKLAGIKCARDSGFLEPGRKAVIVTGEGGGGSADGQPAVSAWQEGGKAATRVGSTYANPATSECLVSSQALAITHELVTSKSSRRRLTKVVCSLGPKCWSGQGMLTLLRAGADAARLDMTVGSHSDLQEVVDQWNSACQQYLAEAEEQSGYPPTKRHGLILHLKSPTIRTSMLWEHKRIALEEGDVVKLVAVGETYASFQGFKDETSATIGLSLSKIHVQEGDEVLLSDGQIIIVITATPSETEVHGVCQSSKKLGERKTCNIPLAKQDTGRLWEEIGEDISQFALKNRAEYISVFAQTREDVQAARDLLEKGEDEGGRATKVLARVENAEALRNYDEILELADGVVISRGLLGREIRPEKVALAQKWCTTKARLAGKTVLVSDEVMESVISNPRPTRAEMTDAANSVLDGADAIVLARETSIGMFPESAVSTIGDIARDVELGLDTWQGLRWLHNLTPKPMLSLEGVAYSAVSAAVGMSACLMGITTNSIVPARLLSKYRPGIPIIVATTDPNVAAHASLIHGLFPLQLESAAPEEGLTPEAVLGKLVEFARAAGLASLVAGDDSGDQVVMVMGLDEPMISESQIDMQYVTMVVGDEAADVSTPSFYDGDETISYSSTKFDLASIMEESRMPRKTKIVCTIGPRCWSEEGIEKLLDSGMDMAKIDFGMGSHADHQDVLQRLRQVFERKGSHCAVMMDLKGREIRTAMLKGHKRVFLKEGQEVVLVAVGGEYTSWEGSVDPQTGETRIGVSYTNLCKSCRPGSKILVSEGAIVIEVTEAVSNTELRGRILRGKRLGERKLCNLPGAELMLPVLGSTDLEDLDFACRQGADIVAVPFVQSAEDVEIVRRELRGRMGGDGVKVAAKIENAAGVRNFDSILRAADAVVVARARLGLEVPGERIAVVQKMICTKAAIAGKPVMVAGEMLLSMVSSIMPTRAEATDVANAAFDSVDAVVLTAETSNGSRPHLAVATASRILSSAEEGVNSTQLHSFIRDLSAWPARTTEAIAAAASSSCTDMALGLVLVVSADGTAARMVAKYRPRAPILVVSSSAAVLRFCGASYGLRPFLDPDLPEGGVGVEDSIRRGVEHAVAAGLCPPGREVMVVRGSGGRASADELPAASLRQASGEFEPVNVSTTLPVVTARVLRIHTARALDPLVRPVRKTKVVCTLGPRCWSEEGIASLLDAGLDVARLNFSHGSHADHQRVLDRFRAVCGARGSSAAVLLDTKGPEIRTAMLRGGKDIDLAAGQEVTVVAVGDEYETWEGFRDEATGETRIGLSYSGLCQTVRRGSKILIADGSILVAVEEVTSSTELRGRVVSGGRLGQRKNCNLPGVRVNLPMPTTQDIRDLQQFACPNAVDYVAASFVQTADDIDSIRAFLDDSDGQSIQIIAKIENAEGLRNFDEILHRADGIMVARGDLGMEIPSEKVALAQKMMVTKANLAGKPVICATQMLGSMVEKPTPTRAEMTDVANAVFDGVDAVMLSGETASSPYFREAAATMAAIASNAETTAGARLRLAWICDFSRQPLSSMESLASSAVMAACDRGACGIIVASGGGHMAAAVSKFRPPVPIVVATCSMAICRRSRAVFGQVPCFVESLDNPEQVMEAVQIVVREIGAVSDRSLPAILVRGSGASMDADTGARLGIVQLNP